MQYRKKLKTIVVTVKLNAIENNINFVKLLAMNRKHQQ